MLKVNKNKKKNKFDYLLNILILIVLISIIIFNRVNIVYGANINWIEISKTNSGIQYLDKDSIHIKGNGIIELSSKYLKLDTNTTREIEENIYTMSVNCLTNKFKDISVNGKKNLTAKWEDPNGDKLLDDLISASCKNVSLIGYLKE